MSLKGVRQLKELLIRYSDLDGSSKHVREWIRTGLVEFASANPELTIKTELKRSKHPFLRGHYLNGNTKTIDIKNQPIEIIEGYLGDLRNQLGRKVSQSIKLPKMRITFDEMDVHIDYMTLL
jgi:large subunit ribosomal protein L43